MVFSSLAFIFRFMPLFFLCYFLTPKPFRNIVLFLGSIIFYAVGEPVYVLLMLFSILVNFYALCAYGKGEKGKAAEMAAGLYFNTGFWNAVFV